MTFENYSHENLQEYSNYQKRFFLFSKISFKLKDVIYISTAISVILNDSATLIFCISFL